MKKTENQSNRDVTTETTLQNGPVDQKRRIAVLGAVGGASTLAVWHKPIVDAVLLPAHAQMSETVMFFTSELSQPMTSNTSPLDFVISSANAGDEVATQSQYEVELIQTAPGVDSYDCGVFERIFQESVNIGEALYRGTISEASGGTLGLVDGGCNLKLGSIDVNIDSISADLVELTFTSRGEMVSAPSGTGILSTPACPLHYAIFSEPVFVPDNARFAGKQSDSLLDLVVPKAQAEEVPGPLQDATARNLGDGFFEVFYQRNDVGRYSGVLQVGAMSNLSGVSSCNGMLSPIDATITGANAMNLSLDISIDFKEFATTLTLPVDEPILPPLDCFFDT